MSWTKVFENSPTGAGTGSISGLVSLIRQGADLKVGYDLPGPPQVFWSRSLSSVTVATIGGGGLFNRRSVVVSGVVTDIPDTNLTIGHRSGGVFETFFGTHNGTGGRSFADRPVAYEWQIFNSSGQRRVVKFDASTHQVLSVDVNNLRLYWYADL